MTSQESFSEFLAFHQLEIIQMKQPEKFCKKRMNCVGKLLFLSFLPPRWKMDMAYVSHLLDVILMMFSFFIFLFLPCSFPLSISCLPTFLFLFFLVFLPPFLSVSWPGIKPRPWQWKRWVLITVLPGNSPPFLSQWRNSALSQPLELKSSPVILPGKFFLAPGDLAHTHTYISVRFKESAFSAKVQVQSLDREIPWSMNWEPIPVFLPGKSHGQRNVVGYGPWGHKELDTTEHPCTHAWKQ